MSTNKIVKESMNSSEKFFCRQYWALEDYNRKKGFILGNTTTFEPTRRSRSFKQQNALHAHFFTSGEEVVRVSIVRGIFLGHSSYAE